MWHSFYNNIWHSIYFLASLAILITTCYFAWIERERKSRVFFYFIIVWVMASIIMACLDLRDKVENTGMQVELKTITQKNAEVNATIMQNITGGDSFPYVFVGFEGATGFMNFNLYREGNYPLYDITLQITDHHLAGEIIEEKNRAGEKIAWRDVRKWWKQINAGNLMVGQILRFDRLEFPASTDEMNFTVNIMARNGLVNQTVKITRNLDGYKREDNHFKVMSEIKKNGKVIKKLQ